MEKTEDTDVGLEKARRDLAAAGFLRTAPDPAWDIVVYHCQQTAEKSLKAILVRKRTIFRKTHDLEALLALITDAGVDASNFGRHAKLLSPYAVQFRYPGDEIEPEAADAIEAIEMAREVFNWARQTLGVA